MNLTVPFPSSLVSFPIAVPNVPALANSSLWPAGAAARLAAVRASAVVVGVIR